MLGLAFTMLVAVITHKLALHDPFVNLTGGSSYEMALVYLVIAILFLVSGAGKFSVDYKLFGERRER